MALLIWLLWRAYRAFLWKVGRRLAFSYFLLGVLPIPLLLLLLAVLAYLLSGFFLGHLYRDAVQSTQGDLVAAAQGRLAAFAADGPPRRAEGGGRRLRLLPGRQEARRRPAPARRLAGLAGAAGAPPVQQGDRLRTAPRFVSVPGGRPTLAAAASRDGNGVVALYSRRLRRRAQPARRRLDRDLPLRRSRPRHHRPGGPRAQGPSPPHPQGPAGRRGGALLQAARARRALLGPAAPLVGGDLGPAARPLDRPAGGRLRGGQPERHAQHRAAPPLLQRRRDRRPRLAHPARRRRSCCSTSTPPRR